MRKFPIYIVVDVSESMVGTPHTQIEQGLRQISADLLQDPYALETVWVSVIAFAGRPRTLTPLTELPDFSAPFLPVGAGTGLGAVLIHLMDEIDRNVTKTTANTKGDYKPLVFLMTDGHPTDDPDQAIRRWVDKYKSKVNLVAVSIGGQANEAMLRRLTDEVFAFDDRKEDSFKKFIAWITASVAASSRSVSAGGGIDLRKMDDSIEVAPGQLPGVDDRFAVFTGRCSKSKAPYVVKFEKHNGKLEGLDPRLAEMMKQRNYLLNTAVPVQEGYFELSDGGVTSGQKMSTSDLIGQPDCPHCHAPYGMAFCSRCGGIHCYDDSGSGTCPWCGITAEYGSSGGSGFDVNRGKG